MNNFFKEIENKLNDSIKIENILIIDNSAKHMFHKFYDKEKYHLKLEIKSQELKSLSSLEAHKKIVDLMANDKKNNDNKINLILLKKIGQTTIPGKYKVSNLELKKAFSKII